MRTRIDPVLDGLLTATGCREPMAYTDRDQEYVCDCGRERIDAVTAHSQTLDWLQRIGLAHRQQELTRECLRRCGVDGVAIQNGRVLEGGRAR